MKKLLPINLNTGITTDCWNFYRLAVILSDEKLLPWFVERFIEVLMHENFTTAYYDFGSLDAYFTYDEVLEYEEIINKEAIISVIFDSVNRNGYVYLYWDRYFIKESPFFKKDHSLHDMLIIGYDDKQEEIYYIDIGINNILWGIHTVKFDNFVEAFSSGLKIVRERPNDFIWLHAYYLPACIFYLKNKTFNRGPRLGRIYASLEVCLRGREFINKKFVPDKNTSSVFRSGTSIYKGYYEDLNEVLVNKNSNLLNENKHILYGIKRLIESKNGLLFRLNYLNKHNYVTLDESLVKNIKQLLNTLEISFQLMSKYAFTMNIKYLERANQRFKEAEELDICVLTEAINLFQKPLIERLF